MVRTLTAPKLNPGQFDLFNRLPGSCLKLRYSNGTCPLRRPPWHRISELALVVWFHPINRGGLMGVISVQLSLLAVPFPAMQGMRRKEKRVVLSISMFMLMPPAWHTRDFSLFATSVNARSVRGGGRKTSRQSLTLDNDWHVFRQVDFPDRCIWGR